MFSYHRALRCSRQHNFKIPHLRYSSASTIAGNAVDTDRELFEYTSGRWLYNESLRLAERSLRFNVQELKRVAAASIHRHENDVKGFRKLSEGAFTRVFEITMKDDTQILARLPYPLTVPKRLTVASEVATMDLVRSHDIPVPKILDYSINSENDVGSEYIIMEKVPGNPIGDSWFTLSEEQRLKVLREIVRLESKLSSIELPASGSLYYSHDLPPEMNRAIIRPPLNSEVANRGEICVGPFVSTNWWSGSRALLRNINRGPHFDASECLTAVAKKELAWLHSYGKPRFPFERAYRGVTNYEKSTPGEHIATLEKYLKIAPYFVPADRRLQTPTLRHPDLRQNNIFVSEDLDIVGLMNWEHSSALPLFLAARIPYSIQNYNDEKSHFFDRYNPPKLPESLDQMSAADRATALEQFRRRHLHFHYLEFSQSSNPLHFYALHYDGGGRVADRAFTYAGDPWDGNNNYLKADLVHILQNWDIFMRDTGAGATPGVDIVVPPCPVKFDPAEAEETLRITEDYQETESDFSLVLGGIGVGVDGWTTNEMFEGAVARLKEARKVNFDSIRNDKFQQEMLKKHWPFDDFDEDE
ncbi:hypothetical protein AJ80_09697 [Polytolypa hystricis UAMH7299]|uniref:Aminoglycoside phosphotransferase domain-containing protein n=1 Tax=Polytolypa hystricis (strain UAMH7299) TaxID=1447883 RepID=A0A2B7WLR3_POLH7|nr:hypothetical protein AJ80_09697 [Polytolypa hystricis UAMH7299]